MLPLQKTNADGISLFGICFLLTIIINIVKIELFLWFNPDQNADSTYYFDPHR